MGVVVRKSFVRLADLPITTREDMREVGRLLISRIRERTAQGVDAEGAGFRSYSPGYAKRKTEAGGTSRVNLAVSGEMLNAIDVVDVTDKTVTLGFRR